MSVTTEKLIDITVIHQIGLQRYSNTVLRNILSTLRQMTRDIEAKIALGLPAEENQEPSPDSLRLRTLLDQVRQTQIEAHGVVRARLDEGWDGAVEAEAAFVRRTAELATANITIGTDAALATVSAPQLKAAVMSRPMAGKYLRDWAAKLDADDRDRAAQQIRMGYLQGESVPQMVRRVRTAAKTTERAAEALVRTSMTHINGRAVAENAKANPHLFERYQWISVLDNRTSAICRSLAGRTYQHGNGPLPPQHVNCRSTIYSLVRGVAPSDDLGFKDWLKRQSAADQRDVLGPARYKLWKQGGIDVDRFVQDGRQLTLDQLKARDAEAFRRAGL